MQTRDDAGRTKTGGLLTSIGGERTVDDIDKVSRKIEWAFETAKLERLKQQQEAIKQVDIEIAKLKQGGGEENPGRKALIKELELSKQSMNASFWEAESIAERKKTQLIQQNED